ncbi:MAG: DUF937 domain-containing protein [Hyphomicrobium sp.]|nr:DUF937 domain-containing protein [Hyphomicrobium sp.]
MTTSTVMTEIQKSGAIQALAARFELPRAKIEPAVAAVVGELAWAIEGNTLNRGGTADLVRRIGSGNYAAYLDPLAATTPEAIAAGDELLGDILGSKHASRGVANRVAGQTGVPADVVRQLLPVVADLLVGALSKTTRGPLEAIMKNVSLPESGALPPIADTGRDGSGRPATPGREIAKQEPLPIPGEMPRRQRPHETPGRNPFDDLSDVIRRGGARVPRPSGGGGTTDASRVPETGSLDKIIRDILGGNLGFETRGIVGYLIQLVIARYGWRIVQWLLGRLMGRR